jgi:hypothetical protein
VPELRPLPVYGYEIQKWLEISHTELWADVLYNYLDDILQFPFSARCVTRRATSPLKPGDKVKVVGMAPAEEYCFPLVTFL